MPIFSLWIADVDMVIFPVIGFLVVYVETQNYHHFHVDTKHSHNTTVVNTVANNQQYTFMKKIKQKIDAVLDCNEIAAKVRACKRKVEGRSM